VNRRLETVLGVALLIGLVTLFIIVFPKPNPQYPNENTSHFRFSSSAWGDGTASILGTNHGNESLIIQQIYIGHDVNTLENFTAQSNLPLTVNREEEAMVTATFNFTRGVKYTFRLVCSDGLLTFDGFAPSVAPAALILQSIYWRETSIIFVIGNQGEETLNVTRFFINATDVSWKTNLPLFLNSSEGGVLRVNYGYEYDVAYTFLFMCNIGNVEISALSPVSAFNVSEAKADVANNWLTLVVETPHDEYISSVWLSADNQTFVDITENSTAMFEPALRAGASNTFIIYFPNTFAIRASDRFTYYAHFTMISGREYYVMFSTEQKEG